MRVRGALLAAALSFPAVITAAQDVEKLLSRFTPAEQESIRSVCAGAAPAGAKAVESCIRAQAEALKESPGPPSLSTLAPDLQRAILDACRDANRAGPARYYDCLQEKATELRQSPGRPDLSIFSSDDQAAMRSACRAVEAAGPARWYACLRAQIAELRRLPGRPNVTAFSAADQAAMREACADAGASGAASFYACLGAQAAARQARPVVAPRARPMTPTPPHPRAAPPPRASASPARQPSAPAAQEPVAIVQPDRRGISDQLWMWIAGLAALAGWPVARRVYKASTSASGDRRPDDDRRPESDDAGARFRSDSSGRPRAHEAAPSFDPCAVLGVPADATLDQIKIAYRALIVQYHPDKVAQLGPELRQLAADKSRQINDAYRMLERRAK